MRNYSVDLLKVVFSLFIAIGHAGIELVSSDIIVHCFFILSGFYMVKSYDSGKYKNSLAYTKARFFRIFPYYIVALGIFLVVHFVQNGMDLRYILSKINMSVPEILLLQNAGFFITGGVNYPLWQMSVLFITGYILFGFLSFDRKLTISAICPLIILMGFAYWHNIYNSHNVERWGLEWGCIYVPLIRGFSAMSLGVFLYDIILEVVVAIKRYNNALMLICLFLFSLIYYGINNSSSLAYFGFVGILIVLLSSEDIVGKILNKPIFTYCEKVSLSIYFIHAIVLQIVGRDILRNCPEKIMAIIVYCFALISFSFVYIKVVELGLKKNKKWK